MQLLILHSGTATLWRTVYLRLSLCLLAAAQLDVPVGVPASLTAASPADAPSPQSSQRRSPLFFPPALDDNNGSIAVVEEPPVPQRPITDDSGAIYYAPDPNYTEPYFNDGWRWGGTTGWIVAVICILLAVGLGSCGIWVLLSRRQKQKKSYYGLQEEGEVGMVRHDGLTRPTTARPADSAQSDRGYV